MAQRPKLEVKNLVKRHSKDVCIGPISFELQEGEFFSLLGTSGCGKTTILRCIAGFERPDEGTITLNGERIDNKEPQKRGVGLVFQQPALFPTMTVAENIAFGMALQRRSKEEVSRRVDEMLELVGLDGYAGRMPNQLSGGQQQRVALARSLVLEPPLMLMDEPLSSLDFKLRIQMREELRRLQRRLHKSTIFVTHDQGEALALSDRIAVLSLGKIEQIGSPWEVYSAPESSFVADFIGSSNLIKATLAGRSDNAVKIVTAAGLELDVATRGNGYDSAVTALIRPDVIRIVHDQSSGQRRQNSFVARLVDRTFLGEDTQLRVIVDEKQSLLISQKSASLPKSMVEGSSFTAYVDPSEIVLLNR